MGIEFKLDEIEVPYETPCGTGVIRLSYDPDKNLQTYVHMWIVLPDMLWDNTIRFEANVMGILYLDEGYIKGFRLFDCEPRLKWDLPEELQKYVDGDGEDPNLEARFAFYDARHIEETAFEESPQFKQIDKWIVSYFAKWLVMNDESNRHLLESHIKTFREAVYKHTQDKLAELKTYLEDLTERFSDMSLEDKIDLGVMTEIRMLDWDSRSIWTRGD